LKPEHKAGRSLSDNPSAEYKVCNASGRADQPTSLLCER